MDMYVYKLPDCCAECEHCTKAHEGKFGIPFCNVARMPIYNGQDIKGRGHHTDSFSDFDCPLKLLADHDKNKDQRIAELEKALELACEHIEAEYMNGVYCTDYLDYFKAKAKEELKNE